MVRRTRDIQKKIWLTPQEERTIAKKMEMIGTENFGAYARNMLFGMIKSAFYELRSSDQSSVSREKREAEGSIIAFYNCLKAQVQKQINEADQDIYYGGEKPPSILLPILSAGLCAFTIVRNICLAGWGYGCLGMLFQGVMTLLLFFVVIIAIAGLLARATTRGTNRMSGICSGVSQEIRYAIILLPVFILKK